MGKTLHQRKLRRAEIDSLARALASAEESAPWCTAWTHGRAFVTLTGPGRRAERIQWLGGSRFLRAAPVTLGFMDGPGFDDEAAGRLLEGWTSRPVRMSDDP